MKALQRLFSSLWALGMAMYVVLMLKQGSYYWAAFGVTSWALHVGIAVRGE